MFPWRWLTDEGGMWRLLCFAFALLCFALALLCFAFALQTSRLTRGREKCWWVDCHTIKKLVCPIRPPGANERRDVYSVGKPSSTCTWMEPRGLTPGGSFQVFPPKGSISHKRKQMVGATSSYQPCAQARGWCLPERSSALEEA